MKILRVVPFPPEYIGGLPFYCKNLSLQLVKRKKVECDILTSDLLKKNNQTKWLDDSVRVIYKKCHLFLVGKNPVVNIIPFLRKHYKDYDIIHAHGYYFFSTLQCVLMKKLYNFPFILHIHGGIQTSYNTVPVTSNIFENYQLLFKEKIFDRLIGRIPIKSANKIISVAQKDLSIIRDRYKVDVRNSFYIPNGVDIEKFKKTNNFERKYITLLATRLSYIKGVDIFLKIAKELYKKNKNLKFLIIGNGYLKKLVIKAKKNLPIEFYTHYPYENIQDIYNMSKIILITSRFEGVPNVLYESLACETPVISSNVGGISGVINTDENGYLFNIYNYEEAVNIILNLIDDEFKMQKLGINGRRLIEREFSWEIITNRIYDVYKKLLEK